MPFAAYAGGAGAVPAVLGLRFSMRGMRDEAPPRPPFAGTEGQFFPVHFTNGRLWLHPVGKI